MGQVKCPSSLQRRECTCDVGDDGSRGAHIACNLNSHLTYDEVMAKLAEHGGLIEHLELHCAQPHEKLEPLPKLKVGNIYVVHPVIFSLPPF